MRVNTTTMNNVHQGCGNHNTPSAATAACRHGPPRAVPTLLQPCSPATLLQQATQVPLLSFLLLLLASAVVAAAGSNMPPPQPSC
jgi:hypothetical protein